mgnify:FL=1
MFARAVLFQNPTVASIGEPMVEVVATAKTDLKKGDTIDGIGGYMTYGVSENHRIARDQNLLPMAFADKSVLLHDVAKDTVLTLADVAMNQNSLALKLWQDQEKIFTK